MRVRDFLQAAIIVMFLGLFPVLSFSQEDNDALYKKVAEKIIHRITALKNDFPHFSEIESKATKIYNQYGSASSHELPIIFHYEHALQWKDNPNYSSEKKENQKTKLFSEKDGIELNLYFFKGPWVGQAAVYPIQIGDLNTVFFLEGADTDDLRKIRSRLQQIIVEEKQAFEKDHP